MEGLLNPVSISYKSKDKKEDAILVEVPRAPRATTKPTFQASTPEEALEILKNEPDYQALTSTLRFLGKPNHDFNIASPSPVASQLVHALVAETLPNYWNVVYEPEEKTPKGGKQRENRHLPDLELLLKCLRSVTGLNAILLSLKRHVQLSKETKKTPGGPNLQDILVILLQVLSSLLKGDQSVERIWRAIWASSDPPQNQRTIWNEFLGLVGGGKILGTVAEAEDIVNDLSQKIGEKYWIADGSLYSSWLARNISNWAKSLPKDSANGWKCCSELLTKTFRLGYTEKTVNELLKSLLLQSQSDGARFTKLLSSLPTFEQRNLLYALLQIISKEHLSTAIITEADSSWWKSDAKVVSGAAGLIKSLVNNEEPRKAQLLSWLTSSTGAGVGEGIAIRRAVVTALAEGKSDMETVLEKSLQQLGDQLYIKHTPTMQQEVHTQVLLLAAGQVNRKSPLRLAMMMRSGAHLNVVTNRLGSSSSRVRFLGMVVGEALSALVDKGDKKMDFKVDEMSTAEAKWYKSLTTISDTIGSVDFLKSGIVAPPTLKNQPRPLKPVKKPAPFDGSSKIISIEEVDDDDEEEESDDDGLVPYAKPDSDPEDSDEDATNIIRDKSTVPVYIRDLITYLRDTDNYDRQKLGLQTAAPLIRRKANFGTEVSSHAEELATLLVGIQDKYDMDEFQDLRLQGMIAILVALPLKMGQWFSKTFFDGDYSISQRASVLTTLGLGAREIAGFSEEASSLTSSKPQPVPSFPSKTLPESMHKIYASSPSPAKRQLQSTPISTLTTQLSNTIIAPMAASQADKATGPNILKTRTFSSRMAVEAQWKKPTTNALAKVVADGFFFPLTGRFFIHLKARSNIAFDPFLLALFLKTIALLLHASGPNNMSLPQMTSEAWDLLLGLRTQATSDVGVLEGLLFAVMILVEVNSDKRGLVEGYGRQMLEMQGWVEGVFGRLQGVGGEEEEKVRVLAAGVLVRIRECVEKYQALLLGDLASF
ncbi:DNA replication checkpoint protein tel2 [Lachnellula cervina]|uniref:DNA replication checkpoint protein tel2 n=1 Tax=Lachnellula cervina TaxID=1316786 RepID=A0A7D8URF8_9HELO|nr:DNA replication checkpoint protein tel2 [Lachnellula cervina]